MGKAAKLVLETYDELPPADQEEVLAELLRRAALSDHDVPDDQELVEAANRLFLDLDLLERA